MTQGHIADGTMRFIQSDTKTLVSDHYRCPDDLAEFLVARDLPQVPGFFQFGSGTVCFGQCHLSVSSTLPARTLSDAYMHTRAQGDTILLPFDPVQVVNNLRLERYSGIPAARNGPPWASNIVRNLYYTARPFMSVAIRKHLQSWYLRGWDKIPFPSWPVDMTVEDILERLLILAMKSRNLDRVPFIWFWPDGHQSCAMVTHDVETRAGLNFCPQLMDLNDSFGIKSSFQLVPEGRYALPPKVLEDMRQRGFEVNVHDLNHDGHLFDDHAEFLRRAERIKHYAREFKASGFRSAVLYRNADWCDLLGFAYDMSIPNVAHLDPQRGGCCTVFPFFIGTTVELPVTATQDYSLFHVLKDHSTRLWQEQIGRIRAKHGLMSFIVHPDYVIDPAPRKVYVELLAYLSKLRAMGKLCVALPGQIAEWWKVRSELALVNVEGSWRIIGQGSERARIAYAVRVNDHLVYEMDTISAATPVQILDEGHGCL
ncbi:hypothetical protein ACVIIW_006655 [Bradyrhizobium sp. USDA 4449]